MWEAIEKNKRKSIFLIAIMGLILVGLGAVIGLVVDPQHGALLGSGAAVILWLILMTAALTQGDQIILKSVGARKIKKQDCPRLFNVVEEMTIASGLGTPPAIYIMEDDSPNAFAVGRDPKKAAVAITSGLLARLDRDELQGVMAHEVAHIKNLDVRFLTIATVMVGSIVILSNFYLRAMFYGAGRRRSGKGGGNNAIMIVGIVAAILAPIAARMLYFACSRSREYLADASAARFTRYPPGLASALEKISGQSVEGKQVNQALAPLYIINPLQAHSAQVSNLFSTHPPAARRIKILRSMAGGAGYADYETAFRKVEGAGARCLGAATLTSKEGKRIAAREASEESATDKAANKSAGKKEAVERVREVTDMLDRMAEMVFIGCACGVRIKTPPEYKKETIDCPRCGRSHTIPHAEVQEMMAVGEIIRSSGALGHDKDSEGSSILDLGATTQSETKPSLPPLRYRRTGAGWESFKCSCDKTIQLSPGFRGSAMLCSKCKRQIEIIAAEEQPA